MVVLWFSVHDLSSVRKTFLPVSHLKQCLCYWVVLFVLL